MTLVDVAHAAGVSKSTASRVLAGSERISDDAKERVMSAAARLGYRPNHAARSLRTKRTMLVGLVLNNLVNASFHVLTEVLQQRLDDHGYRVILCVIGSDADREARYLEMLAEHDVDGIVLAGTARNLALLKSIAAGGVPILNCIRHAADAPGDAVLADDPDGGLLATRHLLEHGHRTVGYIGGTPDSNSGRERLQGYKQALAEAGIEPADRLIARGPFTEDFGRTALSELLAARPRPTAIYIANHEASLGAIPELRERGIRVPDDLSIICHEDIGWFHHWQPPITVIDNGATEIAELTAARILTAMTEPQESAEPGRVYRIGARLIERASVATPCS